MGESGSSVSWHRETNGISTLARASSPSSTFSASLRLPHATRLSWGFRVESIRNRASGSLYTPRWTGPKGDLRP